MPIPSHRAPYDIDDIVDIAVRAFLERGYDGTSMDQLADAARIRKSSLYYHVSGKEELLRLGVTRAFDAAFGVLTEPGASESRPLDRLRYVLRRTCEVCAELTPEVALLIRVRGNTETEKWALGRRYDFTERIADLIRSAIAVGEFDERLEPNNTARLMLGMITSTVDWYRPGGAWEPHDLAERVLFLLLDSPLR